MILPPQWLEDFLVKIILTKREQLEHFLQCPSLELFL